MSTRCTTHFVYGHSNPPVAIIYRHTDGYPEGAGVDLRKFLAECAKLKDSRLNDPSYLAGKYVVFLADMFNWKYNFSNSEITKSRPKSRLEFVSVGVVAEDPCDIEFRYTVNCENFEDGLPHISCVSAYSHKQVDIPQIPQETNA